MFKTRRLAHGVVPVLAALAFQAALAGASSGTASPSKPSHRSTAKKAAPVPVTKSPVTFSLTSRLRAGKLVVMVDDVPIFNEKFQKSAFVISQTTTWDPVQVTAGKHKLTAKVQSANGKTYVSGAYDLDVTRTKGIELRIRVKGDGLTVEPAS